MSPAPAPHREVQRLIATPIGKVVAFGSLVGLLPAFIVVGVHGGTRADWLILAALGIFVLTLPWSMRQRVLVADGRLRLRFWWLPGADLPVDAIEGLEIVTFHPLSDFGGWGLKVSKRHGRVYCVDGREGIRFRAGDRRYIIASADAAALALALVEAGAPAPASLDPVPVRKTPAYEALPVSG